MTPSAIATTILLAALALTVVVLLANAARRRRVSEDVPPAMRPGYSDEQLERGVLESYMGWGVVLTLFFAVFLPVYWLLEPGRLNTWNEGFFVQAYEQGEELYQANCSTCHGTDASGGAATSPYGSEPWPAPALNNIVKRYENNKNVPDVREFIIQTVHTGRPGTPMPTWGSDYGGPLTDQQIEDIADWILANQVDEIARPSAAVGMSGQQLFEANCARCHGRDLQGVVGPTLIGVFERHSRETVLGILRNGIYVSTGAQMPPWQNGYQHEPYTDEALNRIVDYLQSRQPAQLPPDADQYQTPGRSGQQGQQTSRV